MAAAPFWGADQLPPELLAQLYGRAAPVTPAIDYEAADWIDALRTRVALGYERLEQRELLPVAWPVCVRLYADRPFFAWGYSGGHAAPRPPAAPGASLRSAAAPGGPSVAAAEGAAKGKRAPRGAKGKRSPKDTKDKRPPGGEEAVNQPDMLPPDELHERVMATLPGLPSVMSPDVLHKLVMGTMQAMGVPTTMTPPMVDLCWTKLPGDVPPQLVYAAPLDDGRLAVVDRANHRIVLVDHKATFVDDALQLHGTGAMMAMGSDMLRAPGMFVQFGTELFVLDGNRIAALNPSTSGVRYLCEGLLRAPSSIAVSSQAMLYVADGRDILMISAAGGLQHGTIMLPPGTGTGPVSLAMDADDQMVVAYGSTLLRCYAGGSFEGHIEYHVPVTKVYIGGHAAPRPPAATSLRSPADGVGGEEGASPPGAACPRRLLVYVPMFSGLRLLEGADAQPRILI
jgi:hypothetical protein